MKDAWLLGTQMLANMSSATGLLVIQRLEIEFLVSALLESMLSETELAEKEMWEKVRSENR